MKFHSVVDLVTNSSAMVFTTLHKNAIELTKNGIRNLLEAVGDNRDVNQLFRFEIEMEPGRINDLREDYAYDHGDEDGEFDEAKFQEYVQQVTQARVEEREDGDYLYVAVYSRETGAVVEIWPILQAYEYDATWG